MKKAINLILDIAIFLTILNIIYQFYISKTSYNQIDITSNSKTIYGQNMDYVKYYQEYYRNQDIIGILELQNNGFITLVPQTNNNSYYLNHLVNHQKSKLGSTFLDYRNNINSSQKLIIYGHNSFNNKTPFNKLINLLDYKYYLLHPFLKFTTKFYQNTYQIFSVYTTKSDYTHTKLNFIDSKDYLNHIYQLKEKSTYNIDVNLTNSPIIVLQTCLDKKNILVVSAIKTGGEDEKNNFTF